MESLTQNPQISNQNSQSRSLSQAVLRVKNDRMAGSVPSWDIPKPKQTENPNQLLSSYRPVQDNIEIKPIGHKKTEFGFRDLLDMVNPMHHIPVVNTAYRAITGDEIKPASKIIGGAIFGGPIGVAGGLVNAVIEQETGQDVLENAASFAGIQTKRNAQQSYNVIKEHKAYEDLPAALLAFTQTPVTQVHEEQADQNRKENEYKYTQIAQGRTAGKIVVYS